MACPPRNGWQRPEARILHEFSQYTRSLVFMGSAGTLGYQGKNLRHSGSLSGIFCGKIQIKNSFSYLTRHSMAVTLYYRNTVIVVVNGNVDSFVFINMPFNNSDRNLPIFGHCMGCVRRENDAYLVDLNNACHNRVAVFFQITSSRNCKGNRHVKQLCPTMVSLFTCSFCLLKADSGRP